MTIWWLRLHGIGWRWITGWKNVLEVDFAWLKAQGSYLPEERIVEIFSNEICIRVQIWTRGIPKTKQ